ncbi:MAG: FadR family transcriptional regulator [Subtercola sp.]|nr:FadR family transcriptional regulator [Subtercola sp.]
MTFAREHADASDKKTPNIMSLDVARPTAGSHPKMAEELAYKLESLVMERGWPIGQILGSEPELIEQFGVSRAVFREAVRIVEHHGAARMRRGPKGGLIVTAPDLRAVQRPTTLWLDYANVSTSDLYTVRSTLEMTCVGIVAANLTESGAAELRAVLESERSADLEGIREGASHQLHVTIARLSGNPALLLFVETLAFLTFERTHDLGFQHGEFADVSKAHSAIVEALIAGDAALAQHRMRSHLSAAMSYYQQRADVNESFVADA